MDKRIIAIIVVAIVVVAGVATFVVLQNNRSDVKYDDASFNVIGRVNSEGSGLYINDDLVIFGTGSVMPARASNNVPFFGKNYSLSTDNKNAWGGLIFGDPGVSSIQHTQLASIASSVGLKLEAYKDGQSIANDTLYYITNLANYNVIHNNDIINGGIIWEPQFQRVVQEDGRYEQLALTNDVFSGHTCCIIAANHNWAQSNHDTVVKFLAGYMDAVNFIVNAIEKGGSDYDELVTIAMNATVGLSEAEVEDALANITYLYADNKDGDLSKLKKDISSLSSDLKDLGVITSKKFNNPDKFADAFVDDSYVKDAAAGKATKTIGATVNVAVIDGDIHQLAIHVAIAKSYFADYGLNVTLAKGANGGEIATLLLSKDVNIGFLGAPPATSNTINGDHILVG